MSRPAVSGTFVGSYCRYAIGYAAKSLQYSSKVVVDDLSRLKFQLFRRFMPKHSQNLLLRQNMAFRFEVSLADAFQYCARSGHSGRRIRLNRRIGALILLFQSSYAV